MKLFIDKMVKIIVFITLMFFWVIFYNALLFTDMSEYLNSIIKHTEYIYWFGVIILGGMLLVLFKFISTASSKKRKYLKYGLILLLLFLQIFMLVDLNFLQVTDAYLVNDQARALAFGIDKTLDYESTVYFTAYSNNNFCVLLVMLLTKLVGILNLTNYNNYLVLFNILMIDLGIFFTYKIALEVKGESFALKTLVFSVLNPFNYLFINWTYTCTYSIAFTVLGIYLFIYLGKRKKIDIKSGFVFLFLGLVIVVGYLLRPTMVIPLIAMLMVLSIGIIKRWDDVRKFLNDYFKKLVLVLMVGIIGCSVFYKVIDVNIKRFAVDNSESFPIAHWIMMGLHGEGVVTDTDNNFTLSYKTTEEKREANIKEIKRTLKEYGFSGLVNHLLVKLPVTWSDGISSYEFRAGYLNKSSKLYSYLYGEKNDLVDVYCQAFRILTIFLVIVSLINQLKSKMDYRFLFSLTLFGAILFYLIWEAKNAYSIPFIPFMIILGCDALCLLERFSAKIKRNDLFKKIGLIGIGFTVITFISLENGFTKNIEEYHDYQINMRLDYDEWIDDLALNDREIVQEFYATKRFNYISLGVNTILDNQTKYDIKVYDGDKELAAFEVGYQDVKNNLLKLEVDSGEIKEKKKYLIVISPNYWGVDDSIKWAYRFSKATDQYEGKLLIDNEVITSDLALSVYYQYEGTYMSWYKYYGLLFVVILMEVFIMKCLIKGKKSRYK